jgi:hypothetical protein
MNNVWGGQALSETDVFVVGGTYQAGKIVRYDGNDWVPQNVPNTAALMSVFALSPNEAYAVGRAPKWDYDCIMIELSSGNTWTTTNDMYWSCQDVWGTSSDDLFLVAGDSADAKIYRGPKTGPWTEMTLPTLTGDLFLTKVWGTSADDVYAVGYLPSNGVLLHYDGNSANEWIAIVLDPSIDELTSVSGSGPCDVTVGGRAQDGGVAKGVTAHYDGNAWSSPVLHPDVEVISGVSSRAMNEIVATGNTASPSNEGKFGSDDGNLGLLWDSSLSDYGFLRGVSSVPGSNLVFAFGQMNGGTVLRASCN